MLQINNIREVTITDAALEQLEETPTYIKEKLYKWVEQVKLLGLYEVRKIKGYHDEPLKGARAGQRSIRLNKAYRAIYTVYEDGTIKFVTIQEVHKHDY